MKTRYETGLKVECNERCNERRNLGSPLSLQLRLFPVPCLLQALDDLAPLYNEEEVCASRHFLPPSFCGLLRQQTAPLNLLPAQSLITVLHIKTALYAGGRPKPSRIEVVPTTTSV
jgi:hypothetical protein